MWICVSRAAATCKAVAVSLLMLASASHHACTASSIAPQQKLKCQHQRDTSVTVALEELPYNSTFTLTVNPFSHISLMV